MKADRTAGFTLIEVMVAVALAGLVMTSAVSTFKTSLDEQALATREWQAFTIAQQHMEMLSALPRDHTFLTGNNNGATTTPGSDADGTCTGIADGAQHFRVNRLGVKTAGGQYDVCYKVWDGNPIGALRNVRVVVAFNFQGARHVLLQTIR
ncbi:MAG TPA: type II secretion system protein [Myxococcota bacterium]